MPNLKQQSASQSHKGERLELLDDQRSVVTRRNAETEQFNSNAQSPFIFIALDPSFTGTFSQLMFLHSHSLKPETSHHCHHHHSELSAPDNFVI